ncbi:MAG: hypothetical protein AB2A00_42605 [Myxococcota bacterium]
MNAVHALMLLWAAQAPAPGLPPPATTPSPAPAQPEAPAAEAPPRPLVVVLPVDADKRAQAADTLQFDGMLQSELSSAARGADVSMLADAVAQNGVTDVAVLKCVDVSCAGRVGEAVKARYVVVTQVASVGRERVVTVRMMDTSNGRVVAMLTEKAGTEDESLPPVAARAALRLAAAARIDQIPEVKPPPAPAPAPAPAPIIVPAPAPAPEPPPEKIIIVPARPPEPPPVVEAPPPEPTPAPRAPPKEEKPKRSFLASLLSRIGLGILGVVVGVVALLPIPALLATAVGLYAQAFYLRSQLYERPHLTSEIDGTRERGLGLEVGAHALGVVSVLLAVVAVVAVAAGIGAAVFMPY